MKNLAIITSLFFMAIGTSLANADNVKFASRPSLTPDGQQIYFSYDGDIYRVPVEGGQATAVITMVGNQNCPLVSPDGKLLAFSSDIQGNSDIYVVPVDGGQAVQLTYHEAGDVPISWSPDSKYIYFESSRGSARKTSYRVSVYGGTPELLFNGYFNTIVNVVENPKTGEFLFNESGESISSPTRKRYVGAHNPNIKSYNPKTKAYKELTDYIGKDAWPMADKSGNIYYVSDEFNQESNIVKYIKGSKPEQLTTFDKSIQYPNIAFNGSKIVFLNEYEITVLDPKTKAISVPKIEIASGNVEVRRAFEKQTPSAADVSPDGKKFALVIRGQLYVSDTKCKYLQHLDTPNEERVDEVLWASDSKTIYYTRSNKGWFNIFKIAADGSQTEKPVFLSQNNVQALTFNHKHDKIAFIDGSHSVMILDTANDIARKIADAEFWSFQNYEFNFSSDDNLLAFSAMNKFESDVFIYNFQQDKLTNLTNSASIESGFVFAPDGKNAYLLANPISSSFPKGTRANLYKLPLQKYDTPFKSDDFDKLFVEETKKKNESSEVKNGNKKDNKKDNKKVSKKDNEIPSDSEKLEKAKKKDEIKIDFNDIYRRMTRIERGEGSQSGTYVFSTKGKDYLLYSSFSGMNSGLYSLDITDPEAKPKQIKEVNGGSLFSNKESLYAISRGIIYKIEPGSGSAQKIEVSKNVEIVLADEFSQMFYEVWGMLEQNYYDVNFHGTDWYKVRDYYASFLPYVRTRSNLRTLITDMLGELNSSHLGFTSNGSEEKYETRIRTISTGIEFQNTNPYKVDRILKYSPADKVSIDIKKGDELVAVDGIRVDNKINREKYFSSTSAKDELKLTFKRGAKEFVVKVHTTTPSTIKELEYTEWEDQRKEIVTAKTGGKVAYHHMQAMGNTDLNDFMLTMHTDAVNKDALILDLRYNNGGNVHKEVIDFLRGQEHFHWSYRDFPSTSHPNVAPANKPIIVLVNEHSLSDAEVTSNGIKTLGIAPLVGTETYRWIIFTSSVRLLDGSSCRLPAWGCYNVNTGADLENTGVAPDVYVKNTFKDRLEDKDPQLDMAIKLIMEKLGK